MVTKPTTTYTWDVNNTNTLQPSASLRDDGYADFSIVSAENLNYQLNSIYQWLGWAEDSIDLAVDPEPALSSVIGNFANAITNSATGTITGLASNGTGTIVGCTTTGYVIYTSNYGVTWDIQLINGSAVFRDITYRSSGTLWTVVGDAGLIYTATSPEATWTSRTSGVATDLNGCHDDGTTLVVVGDSNVILTATDPTSTYTSRTSALAGGTQLNDVVKGSSIWLIVANGGLAQTATTPTGTWTSRTTGVATNLTGCEYGNATYVIGGDATGGVGTILYTADPTVSFSTPNINRTTSNVTRGAYNSNNGLWILGHASGKLAYAEGDLSQWYLTPIGTQNVFSAVYNGNKKTVIGGATNTLYITDDMETLRDQADTNTSNIDNREARSILTSLTTPTAYTDADVTSIAGAANQGNSMVSLTNSGSNYLLVATSAGVIRNTVNAAYKFAAGDTWTSVSGALTLHDVAYDGTTNLVAVGGAGILYTAPTPGTTWTSRTSGTANELDYVAAGGGFWVALGGGANNTIRYNDTTDPTDAWSASTSGLDGTTSFRGAAFGVGKFCAITTDNEIITTTTPASTWVARTNPTTGTWTFLRFTGKLFIAGGNSGLLITSPDGITWTTRTISGGPNFVDVTSITLDSGNIMYILKAQSANSEWYYAINTFASPKLFNGDGASLATTFHPFYYDSITKRFFFVDAAQDLNFSKQVFGI